jgi:hypothetical protein
MAAAPIQRPSGQPTPRSPTLSVRSFDSSMILPGDALRSISPPLFAERPPSPSSFYAHANRSTHTLTLATAPPRLSPKIKTSPPLSSQSSHSTLKNMNISQPTVMSPALTDDTLASSPTVQDGLLRPISTDMNDDSQRRLSTTSSLNSEDLEMIRKRWPGFDGQGFDDSGVDLEDEENHDQFPSSTPDSEAPKEPWASGYPQDKENTYSSDLYARRAEMILADAKKRLNVRNTNSKTKPGMLTIDRLWKITSEVLDSRWSCRRRSTAPRWRRSSSIRSTLHANEIGSCTLE